MSATMILLIVLVTSFGLIIGQSQSAREFVHPLTNMPPQGADIDTSFVFPDQPDMKFPLGEPVTVLCHLSNNAEGNVNITAIMGSLNSPFDFNFHIQNFRCV
jgi:hypothetical protein